MSATVTIALVGLGIAWLVLLFATFHSPDAPGLDRLLFFLLWLVVSVALGYIALVYVFRVDPDPYRVDIAHGLTDDRIVDLMEIVPGVYDLDYIHRIDTDWAEEEEDKKREWLVFYRYDVVREGSSGPFGGAIYDYDRCRPPTIHAYELVPVSYDYLGEDNVNVQVDNIIEYKDPLSLNRMADELDRPEVIVTGIARGVATDLNIFRKVGWDEECVPRRTVQIAPTPEQVVSLPFGYQNIGSFRGSYKVSRNGATVTVMDRAGFERSQIVVRRVYTPRNGSYFRSDMPGVLLEPKEAGLAFGAGPPDETREVYYPEKTVLAFFLDLGTNPDRAMSYLCENEKSSKEYRPEDFGLTQPLEDLKKVVVCELAYFPDIAKEQNHEAREVRVKVVEVVEGGSNDCAKAHEVICTVNSDPNPSALPYGCDWCLYRCSRAP